MFKLEIRLFSFYDDNNDGWISLLDLFNKKQYLPGIDQQIFTQTASFRQLFNSFGIFFNDNDQLDEASFEKFLQIVDRKKLDSVWNSFFNCDGRIDINDIFNNRSFLPIDIRTLKDLRQLLQSLNTLIEDNHMIHQHSFQRFLECLNATNTVMKQIKTTMINDPSCPLVQESACASIEILARNDHNQVKLMNENVVELIKKAMTNHSTHPAVQEAACSGLRNLAENSDNQVTLMKENVVELIKKAMTNHPTHPGVQQQACSVLWNLAVNGDNQVTLMNENVVELIKKAMTNHLTYPAVQDAACGALANFAVNRANQVTLMKENIVELIKKAMINHPTHPDVQEKACVALCNLALVF